MRELRAYLNAIQRITGRTPKPSGDQWIGCCPIHEADGHSHKPSLTLRQGDKQAVIVHCHAGCDSREILRVLGVNGTAHSTKAPAAVYAYQDAQGVEVRQKVRLEPKDFRIRHKGPGGEWVYKAGDGPTVLYRLPELNAAIAEGRTVFVVEGEKDADRLTALGLVATTNIEGAAQPGQRAKWKTEYTDQLAGAARVVLLPDNDGPGKAHMAYVAQQLAGKVTDVRTLELPGLPDKGDVSDWLKAGHTADELKGLAKSAPMAPPEVPEREAPPQAEADTSEKPKPTKRQGLAKHSQAAEIAFNRGFNRQLAFDPVTESWLRYEPTKGYFQTRPSIAIEQEVYRQVKELGVPFESSYINGVVKCLRYEAIRELTPVDGKVCFRNGVLDLKSLAFTQHSPIFNFTTALPFDWEPKAEEPTFFTTWLLESLNGKQDQVELIRAFINAVITGRADLQRFLEVIGPGGSGKGTLVRVISALIGKEAVHATTLKQLEENRFESAKLYGKKLIIIGDAEKWHGDVSMLKAITGQDAIRFEQKHQQAGECFTFGGMVIIAANQHTEATDYSSGIQRRRITVPFDHVVPVEQRRDLEAEFEPHLPAILKWALDLSQERVTELLRCTSSHVHSLKEARLEALRATNPVAAWMLDNTYFDPDVETPIGVCKRLVINEGANDGDHTTTSHVEYEHDNVWLYPNYVLWCDQNGKKPLAHNSFSSAVIDVAKHMLGKPFVSKHRRRNGALIRGIALGSVELGVELCRTGVELVSRQVIDSVELVELSSFNKKISLGGEESSSHIAASASVKDEVQGVGEEDAAKSGENDGVRQLRHFQALRSTPDQHQFDTDQHQFDTHAAQPVTVQHQSLPRRSAGIGVRTGSSPVTRDIEVFD